MYVRYFLVFRLWRKIHSRLPVKKKIHAQAVKSLPYDIPNNLPKTLLQEVLPRTKTTTKPKTSDYLAQQFDLRKSCNNFLEYCRQGDLEGCSDIKNVGTTTKTTTTTAATSDDTLNDNASNGASQPPESADTERDPRVRIVH